MMTTSLVVAYMPRCGRQCRTVNAVDVGPSASVISGKRWNNRVTCMTLTASAPEADEACGAQIKTPSIRMFRQLVTRADTRFYEETCQVTQELETLTTIFEHTSSAGLVPVVCRRRVPTCPQDASCGYRLETIVVVDAAEDRLVPIQ